jgi:molybdate transport system ATP-binding protein
VVRGAAQPGGAPGLAAEITVEAAADLQLTPGERVWFVVKALEVALYPSAQRHAGP